ncbi:MAG: hypothetical protein Q9M48_13390 [Rhodobacterales bacterium]|nr:hypothetical protein [Rhodobacterales bacterium]
MGKDQNRKDRLKAALKANMAKRKSQTRGRAAENAGTTGAAETIAGSAGADADMSSNENKG